MDPKPSVRIPEYRAKMRKPWVVEYCGDEYAIARTQTEAIDELERLRWAGEIPDGAR